MTRHYSNQDNNAAHNSLAVIPKLGDGEVKKNREDGEERSIHGEAASTAKICRCTVCLVVMST